MKQKSLLKTIILLCALIVGSSAWADTVTLVSGSGTSGYAVPDEWTTSGTVEGGQYLKFDNGTITSPKFAPHTGLSFTYSVATFGSGTNHPLTIRILNASTDEVISETTTATPTSSTYINTDSPLSLGDVAVPFKIQMYGPTGKGVRLRNYSITGTPITDDRTSVNITEFSATYTTLVVDGTPNTTTTSVVNDQSGWPAAYTYESSNTDVATVNGSGVITAVAKGTARITCSLNINAENPDYKAGETSSMYVDITVNNPSHNAIFKINGGTTYATVPTEEGEAITFPTTNPENISDDIVFVGWVAATINGCTDDEPDYVTAATMGNEDVTYYACYATKITSGGIITKTYGFETESDADWTINGPVQSSEEKKTGNYSGRISTNHTYVTFKNKVNVTNFSFEFMRATTNNNYNVYIETSTDNSNWTACETYAMSEFTTSWTNKSHAFDGNTALYVRFRCYNTTAIRYVDDVTITYNDISTTYTDYCTTVAEDTRAEAGISFADATITAEIAGTFAGQALANPNNVSPITWTSTNEAVATVENGVVTMLAVGETTIKASFAGNDEYKKADVSYTLTVTNPVPAIAITPDFVEATTDETEGTLAITYENLTIDDMTDFDIQYYDAEGEEADEPDWIEVLVAEQDPEIGEGYVVSYYMIENEGDERTAYFKVFAMGNTDLVYSNLVTIKQEGAVTPITGGNYVRITNLNQLTDGSKVIIAARYDEEHTNGYYAMPGQTSGKPVGVAFTSETSGNDEILPATITASEDTYYWTVNVTNNVYTFTNAEDQMIGYTSGTNFATGGNNTEWTIESGTADEGPMVAEYTGFVITNVNTNTRAFAFNSTSAFGAYATSNMDSPNYNFYLDFFVQAEETPATESVTITSAKYATYCSANDLDFSDTDVKVYKAKADNTTVKLTEIKDGIVPAGTGVILYCETAGDYDIPITTTEITTISDNELVGTLEDITVKKTEDDVHFNYILQQSSDGIVFNIAKDNGAIMPANRAYLSTTVDASLTTSRLNVVFEDATGISGITNNELRMTNGVYDLQGRRVSEFGISNSELKSGLYIVNGKKVLVK